MNHSSDTRKRRAEAEAMAGYIVENVACIAVLILIFTAMGYAATATFSDSSTPWQMPHGFEDFGHVELLDAALHMLAWFGLIIGVLGWMGVIVGVGTILGTQSYLAIGYAGLWIKKTLEKKGIMSKKKPKFILSDVFPTATEKTDYVVACWGNDEPLGLIGLKTDDGWDLIDFSKQQVLAITGDAEQAEYVTKKAVEMIETYIERRKIK